MTASPHDYNLWKGFAVSPLLPENPEDKSSLTAIREWADRIARPKCERYLTLVHDIICGGEPARQEEYFAYLVDLLALTVQQPGVPSEVAIVLKGERGTGKGMFARNFGALFGRHFAQVAKPEQIVGKFNATCSSKVVIFADEAFYAGDKRDLGALKVLITEPTIRIERKGIDPVDEPNFVHLIMASNEDWHTPAGMQERRFFALLVSDARIQDHEYFEGVQEEMRNGGREALLSYLLTRDITPFRRRQLRSAPRTGELQRQQDRSLSPEMRWWKSCLIEGLIADEEWPNEISNAALHSDYSRFCDSLKINRRLEPHVLVRDVLDKWLGEQRRATDGHKRVNKRKLLTLAESRQTFDKVAGTVTPWEQQEAKNAGELPEDRIPF